MSRKISYRQLFITNCSSHNKDFLDLYAIFCKTLKADMPFWGFRKYFQSAGLEYIDVTFIVFEREIIGFCSAAFYRTTINNQASTIGRAATGILEDHRGNTLPKWKLYSKYMRYWAKHPFRRFVLTAYVANPLVYAMIAKYTGIIYPKASGTPPEIIDELKDGILKSHQLKEKESRPYVVKISFLVNIKERDQQRIYKSGDKNVKHYLKMNPDFLEQYCVVVIIPVNGWNIILSSCRFIYYFGSKFLFKKKQYDRYKIFTYGKKLRRLFFDGYHHANI